MAGLVVGNIMVILNTAESGNLKGWHGGWDDDCRGRGRGGAAWKNNGIDYLVYARMARRKVG